MVFTRSRSPPKRALSMQSTLICMLSVLSIGDDSLVPTFRFPFSLSLSLSVMIAISVRVFNDRKHS